MGGKRGALSRLAVAVVVLGAAVGTLGSREPVSAAEKARVQIGRLLETFFDARGWTHAKDDLLADPKPMGAMLDSDQKDEYSSFPRFERGGLNWKVFFATPSDAMARVDDPRSHSGRYHVVVKDGRWRIGPGTICDLTTYHGATAKRVCYQHTRSPVLVEAPLRPPLVSSIGDVPRDRQRAADLIVATVQTFFGAEIDYDERAQLLEDGDRFGFASMLRRMDILSRKASGLVWVDTIVFTDATHADVSFRGRQRSPYSITGRTEWLRLPRFKPDLNVVVQDKRWKVGRKSFCNLDYNDAYCPDGRPKPTPSELPVPVWRSSERLPDSLPPVVIVDGLGSLWVLRDGKVERWFDAGPDIVGEYGEGYSEAGFGPRGEVFAIRGVPDDVERAERNAPPGEHIVVDRFTGPGERKTVIEEPSGRDIGYDSTFDVGAEGIALLRHDNVPRNPGLSDDDCQPDERWYLEFRPYDALGVRGNRGEMIEEIATCLNGTLGVTIEDASADGDRVLVGIRPNKRWGSERLVTLPDLDVHPCCDKVSDDLTRSAVMAPDGHRLLVDHSVFAFGHYPEVLRKELLVLDMDGNEVEALYRLGEGNMQEAPSVYDWGAGFVAFEDSLHGSERLTFFRLSDHTLFHAGVAFDSIRDLEIRTT